MWFITPTLEQINQMSRHTMVEHLGITITAIGENYIEAQMPVDKRTHQPMGLLHGGASVALAETLGSFGAFLCVNPEEKACVGLEINANHIRSVREGFVIGRATPKHIGKTTQVWEITVSTEEGKLVCVSRLTVQVLDISR
ncbi:MAG: hotdog fold thioesterase [Candidatus Kapabacteria bacterium]|nr:hotdog fold thioesterase [Candidatus Kapabacteria bacterium]